MNLARARVLITGGAGGIGRAIARELRGAGAAILLADRDALALRRAVGELGGPSDRLDGAETDLTRDAELEALAARAAGWAGGVNVLVNAAGVNHFGLLADQDARLLQQTLAINLLAPMRLCQLMLPQLCGCSEAGILNIGSVFGCIGYPGYAGYAASKFGLRGFTEALRRELADTPVRCQYLAPRATDTGINSAAVTSMNAELGNAVDTPEAVARAARALLEHDRGFAVVGWPEKIFARLNALWPALVGRAVSRQLPVIKRHAVAGTAGADPQPARRLRASS